MKKRALVHIVLILAGVFVFGLILKLSLESSEKEPIRTIASTPVEEAEPESQTIEEEPAVYDYNDTVDLGDYQISVKGAESIQSAEEGTKLIQVQINVKNTGKEPVNIDSSYFEVYDQDERKFETDVMTSFGDDPTFIMNSINPGLSLTRKVIFAVPDDVVSAKLAMRDNMFDILGSAEYVYIDLGEVK